MRLCYRIDVLFRFFFQFNFFASLRVSNSSMSQEINNYLCGCMLVFLIKDQSQKRGLLLTLILFMIHLCLMVLSLALALTFPLLDESYLFLLSKRVQHILRYVSVANLQMAISLANQAVEYDRDRQYGCAMALYGNITSSLRELIDVSPNRQSPPLFRIGPRAMNWQPPRIVSRLSTWPTTLAIQNWWPTRQGRASK